MDIQNTLQKIRNTGMTDAEIGIAIDAPQSTVTRLRNGKHKKTDFERGQKIYNLAVDKKVIKKAA